MRHGSRRCFRSLLGALSLSFLCARAAAQELPNGFVAQPIGSGWNSPVGLCFLDERRLLVAERDGRVWYVEDEQKKNLVYDISSEALINGDRGMLGIATPADFDQTGWLYLLLVVDTGNSDTARYGFARLIRVQTEYDPSGNLVALPATRQALLGSSWSTGIASCHLSHTIGALRFLSDGSLVLTTGDNAHYDATDAGGLDPFCFTAGRTPVDQDVGAYRSQYDNTLCGKVLRLDPETGRGLDSNPFYTGNPDDLLSRVYARGLRNPFRFTLMPGTGPREVLFISDVGWDTWEEINRCLGGENFGWPCFEGLVPQNAYQDADRHGLCTGVGSEHARPLLAWHHNINQAGFRGNCASGICVYTGQRYPSFYRGRLFFADYGRDWMRAGVLDSELAIESSISFGRAYGGIVDLVAHPGTGDLVYASIGAGVFRLRYTAGQLPPTAVASATPAYGTGDLDVLLSAAGSSDPESQGITYSWDLGDGLTYTDPEFRHVFAGTTNYLVRLTVTDTDGLTGSTELHITPNNTPPVISALQAPLDGALFVSDEPLRLQASASDAEDGTPQVTWVLDLVHDHHVHPDWATSSGLRTTVTPDSHGPGDNHFIVRCTVTDSRGSMEERTVEIYDQHSRPQAHLVELAESRVRVGQTIAPVGHVDFSKGRVTPKQAKLTWDWGDGTLDVFANSAHHADTTPTHVYRVAGTYKLRLIAELDSEQDMETAVLEVVPPRPAVAIFAPLSVERYIPRTEQQAIVTAITTALATSTSEVRHFRSGQGGQLADWMESLLSDPIPDVVLLLDFVPIPTIADGIEGSLLQRWVAGGNGLVWTGAMPFQNSLGDGGSAPVNVLAAEQFFHAIGTGLVQGNGTQDPTVLAASLVPSLTSYKSERALRYDQLGPEWSVARIFAQDTDKDSDAIELLHSARRGFYAQFLCDNEETLPRTTVLVEYLTQKIAGMRLGASAPKKR